MRGLLFNWIIEKGEGAAYFQKWCHSGSRHLTGQYYREAPAGNDDAAADVDADADADAEDIDNDGDPSDAGSSSNEWRKFPCWWRGRLAIFKRNEIFAPSGILEQEVLEPTAVHLGKTQTKITRTPV